MSTTNEIIKKNKAYKKLSAFKRLKGLISKMTSQEIKNTSEYLNAFDYRYGKTATKASEVFEYILTYPDVTADIAAEHFKFKSVKVFEIFVNRLKDKIGYANTLDVNTLREGGYSTASQMYFIMLAKIARIYDYLGRGAQEEAYSEMKKAITIGKNYEIYDLLIIVLYYKRNYLKLRTGSKGYEKATKEISIYEHYQKCYLNARSIHNEYLQFAGYEGYRAGYVEKFEQPLQELAGSYSETKSQLIKYYYYIIKIGYLQEKNEYHNALNYAIKLLSHVKDNPVVRTKPRMGTAYDHLADCYLFLGEYEHSIINATMAQKYYKPKTLNYSFAEEMEFWGHFYSAQYDKAEKKIRSIINNKAYNQNEYRQNKREYLHACTLFALGKLSQCSIKLEKIKKIQNDRKGWNLGIRILALMVELQMNTDPANSWNKLEALRKQLDVLKEKGILRERDRLIFKILQDRVKKGYPFSKIYIERQAEFQLLESNTFQYIRKKKDFELIDFPTWFKKMMGSGSYEVENKSSDPYALER